MRGKYKNIVLLSILSILISACTGGGIVVSRGTTIPPELTGKSLEQLKDNFLASRNKELADGARLSVNVLMRDLSYMKAKGEIKETDQKELESIVSSLRFTVRTYYSTPNILTGKEPGKAMAMDKWTITLSDSTGNTSSPSTVKIDPPLMQKETSLRPPVPGKPIARMYYNYNYSGYIIFDYQIPVNCKWLEIKFAPPQTGDWVTVRWDIRN